MFRGGIAAKRSRITPAKTSRPPINWMPVSCSFSKKYAQIAVKPGSRVAIKFAVVTEAEVQFSEACQRLGFPYALTGFSAASRIAPMVRYQRMTAYVNGELEPLAAALNWKPVSSGANVGLLIPYDDGVFYGATNVDGSQIAGLVQTYLDLQNSRGRGQEAAEAVHKELEKSW